MRKEVKICFNEFDPLYSNVIKLYEPLKEWQDYLEGGKLSPIVGSGFTNAFMLRFYSENIKFITFFTFISEGGIINNETR